MYDNILTTAVKIAKVIDDGVERDKALSRIAQMQAAANCSDDALDTISQIRYIDIRVAAIRGALENLLQRYNTKNESMPELDWWIEKLMEETLAIPNIKERCPNLQLIILYILPRLNNKEMAISLVKQARNEFVQLDNLIDRSKYLFTASEMFLQLNNVDEATATLELIQERITEIKPHVQQGLLLGVLANEYWKMQDYMSAFECLGSIEDREIQSYAYLQLVELLSNSGLFNDAESIVEQQEELRQKNLGRLLISMGKNVFRSIPSNMKNIVFNINKSFIFNDELGPEDNFDSDNSNKASSFGTPAWVNHLMVIKKTLNINNDQDNSESDNDENNKQTELKIVRENRIESFVQIESSDPKDSDDDDESWKDSDDDDGESWNNSNNDDNESWKNADNDDSDNVNDEDVDEEDDVEIEIDDDDDDAVDDDANDDEGDSNKRDFINDLINNKLVHLPFPEKIRKLHELFLERVINSNQNLDVPKDKYFCLTETSLGVISFNQALPPKLLQLLVQKIFILFHVIKTNKKDNESQTPYKGGKIKNCANRMDKIGFDNAMKEVISLGDYRFAVDCALYYYFKNNKNDCFFGIESRCIRFFS